MREGIYESLLTTSVSEDIENARPLIPAFGKVDAADQNVVLIRHVAEALHNRLASIASPEDRLQFVNSLLGNLSSGQEAVDPVTQLLSLTQPDEPGVTSLSTARPRTPLSDAALLTNARGEPSLGSELKAELESSSRVDLLCAFVKWHGVRLLEPELKKLKERGTPFRVVTTTYMGATERRALDRLVQEFGGEVRIQFDALRTRLHAKAWLFERNAGFDTAYVGSSNLSRSALLDGLEWNVRLSRIATPSLLDKFQATFETYWNDQYFERYNPDTDRDRLDDALSEASGKASNSRVTISLSGLQVRPYPYQEEMLAALTAERLVHDRHRNLVVAATGTGKTVVAALDYRGFCDAQPGERPSLLFIAHRKEILEQSIRTYREVLADPNFGETYVGGSRPERWKHVFASVQSLTSYGVANIPADAFEVVVIDEFHHAQATTYRRILDHLEPNELLGLTATPERSDGVDVRDLFHGRTATELRLWDALGADLLCPFHYFGLADGTDLRDVSWKRGRYDEHELSNVFTGNMRRAEIILKQVRDIILDPGKMRALGFCVSVAHAEFMAETFTKAGIPSRAVSGTTGRAGRESALQSLRDGKVSILFAADLFNEGLDLPNVDTILFLRPTESATVFLQQLGRGLRRTHNKPVLTALDFVGHHRKEFRWDQKLRALTGQTRRDLERGIENGFPFLPAGCQIVLDKTSQTIVLENIKSQVGNSWKRMVGELRSYGDQTLATFMAESGLDLSDILQSGKHSWTQLRRDAGFATRGGSANEEKLLKRVRAFAHVDDRLRAEAYCRVLVDDSTSFSELSNYDKRLAQMLFFSLWPDAGGHVSFSEGFTSLGREQAVRDELRSVVDISFDDSRHHPVSLEGRLHDVPLQIHARYQREEVLAALKYATLERKPNSFREGVLFEPNLNVDAFFITLNKSEADFSPSTMYHDYPISPTLFHWQSQSTTSIESKTGQRYVNGESTVLLFVRNRQRSEFGTSPYMLLGPATYVEHSGSKPISITWRLAHPMPSDFFSTTSVAAE